MFWGSKCLQNSKFVFLWKHLLIKHFQTQKWFNVIFCKFPHNAISHPHKRSEIWKLEYQSVKIQTNLSFSILKDFYIYTFHKMFFLQKKLNKYLSYHMRPAETVCVGRRVGGHQVAAHAETGVEILSGSS